MMNGNVMNPVHWTWNDSRLHSVNVRWTPKIRCMTVYEWYDWSECSLEIRTIQCLRDKVHSMACFPRERPREAGDW